MTYSTISDSTVTEVPPRVSEWRRFTRVFLGRKVVIFGLIVIALFVLIAILAPFIAPYPPNDPNLPPLYRAPVQNTGWEPIQWVGIPLRVSCMVLRRRWRLGLIVVAIACLAGMILGTLAGFYGGWTNNVIMRIIDALMSFPMILLAMVITALMGSGTRNVIFALSVAMMPVYARVMCAQVISIKENDYVTASRSIGANSFRIMVRHTIPNCFPPLIVLVTMMLGGVILAEAGLSFLGIGIKPPTPTWGSMINDGRQYLLTLPILSFAPGVALMLLVFAFNMVGDGLRDALDPRLRGTL